VGVKERGLAFLPCSDTRTNAQATTSLPSFTICKTPTVNKCGIQLKILFMLWFKVFLLIAQKALTERLITFVLRSFLFVLVSRRVCKVAKTDC